MICCFFFFLSMSSYTIITPAPTLWVCFLKLIFLFLLTAYVSVHSLLRDVVSQHQAAFNINLLLDGDYLACVWLLSVVDLKSERPGAHEEERSENFLNLAFTSHLSTPSVPHKLSTTNLIQAVFWGVFMTKNGVLLVECITNATWCLKESNVGSRDSSIHLVSNILQLLH